ncbi:MAG: hypothetical protein P8X96_16400 [Desulfobacteraceae bacterium]
MNSYQKEQLEALAMVRSRLRQMKPAGVDQLNASMGPYLEFRSRLERFTQTHMAGHCTRSCFQSRTSACCSRDGIITFWADVVINAVCATPERMDLMASSIQQPLRAEKCIYLGETGCVWKIRPLVCAMFVCDAIQADVIDADARRSAQWRRFTAQAKSFRWPDRPVLFDQLEMIFLDLGCRSPLMYINNSPGLMRVKQKAAGSKAKFSPDHTP